MLKRISTLNSSKGLLLSRRSSFTARRQTSFSPNSTSSSSSTPPLGLGLRHTNPPDSHSHFSPDPPNPLPNSEEEHELSDQEWELRTGRNIDILQSTLPEFFVTGLMSSWDSQTGEALPHRSMPHIPTLPQALKFTLDPKGKGKEPEHEPIYSPKIRLSYSPPAPLPHPLPQTLQLEGTFISSLCLAHLLLTIIFPARQTILCLRRFCATFAQHPLLGPQSDTYQSRCFRTQIQQPPSSFLRNLRAGPYSISQRSAYTFLFPSPSPKKRFHRPPPHRHLPRYWC